MKEELDYYKKLCESLKAQAIRQNLEYEQEKITIIFKTCTMTMSIIAIIFNLLIIFCL